MQNLDLIVYTDSRNYISKMGFGNKINIKELLCLRKNIIFYFRKIINFNFKKKILFFIIYFKR